MLFVRRLMPLLLVMALLGAACSSDDGGDSSGASSAEETTVTIALAADPATLDPLFADDGSERSVSDNIYEMLLERNGQTGEMEPRLAAELPENIDENTWRFTLREGIEYTNGEPFNADSVVATIEHLLDPDYASEQLGFYEGISGAEKVDDYTVDIKTEAFDPVLPARMSFMKIAPAEYLSDPDFATNPVGTGPYKFESRTPGEEVVLVANPDYWDGAPEIDRVVLRTIEDENARLSALKSGEVQLVTNLPPDFAEEVPQFLHVPGAENVNVRLNNQEPDAITADVRVRRALNLAIDREAIADELFSGYASPLNCSTIPPAAFGYNPNLTGYPYDPEEAKRLLEEAGVAGETITFISTPGRWLKGNEVGEFIASEWEAAGLKVDLQFLEWEKYLDAIFAEQNKPPALYHSSSNDLLDADRQIASYYDSDSGLAAYQNDRVDELADAARKEPDEEVRLGMYEELTQIACDDAAFVFVVNVEDTYGAAAELSWTPRSDQRLFVKEMSLE